MRFSLILLLAVVLVGLTPDNGPSYKTTKAKDGDGIYSMLRRYQLLNSQDNINKFYELNRLKANSQLIRGKVYKLPILTYQYDGSSISSSTGIDDDEILKRIEAYNTSILNLGIIDQPYTESKEIWVPMHTVKNAARPDIVTTPTASSAGANAIRTIDEPLFGADYSKVEVNSELLKNQVFYLVSGHGGPDPGAMSEVSNRAICEDEYAYDVVLRLARKLMEHGAIVEVIIQDPDDGIRDEELLKCDRDERAMGTKKIPLRQLVRLQQRTHEINKLSNTYRKAGIKKQSVVCVHVDSRNPKSRQDVFFYYCEGSKTGRNMAFALQKTFKEKYQKYRPNRNYSGTVSTRGLYVLRHTDPPAVYVELANIKNAEDRKRILPKENRQALANWIFEGLTR